MQLILNTHITAFLDVQKSESNITELYNDGTSITTGYSNYNKIKYWLKSDISNYSFTIDKCIFPCFSNVAFLDTPRRSLSIMNAGGSSEKSEALSMQYMFYRFGAIRFIPEMEVDYWIECKICDFIMNIGNENIGVSVTRAMSYPSNTDFTYDNAIILLNKKLYGLVVARNCVSDKHKFFRSILHIWCSTSIAAQQIKSAYYDIIKTDFECSYDNVYVICSICNNNFIYTNKIL